MLKCVGVLAKDRVQIEIMKFVIQVQVMQLEDIFGALSNKVSADVFFFFWYDIIVSAPSHILQELSWRESSDRPNAGAFSVL